MPTLQASSEDTRVYELCLLYPHALPQKEENTLLRELDGLLAEAGARLIAKDAWGRRGLAYPIGGATEGNYVIYYMEMEPAKVKEIDTQLRIMKHVLRHLFVMPPKHYQVVQFSETYQQWLKERESVTEKRAREKEDKLKEAVARKAKRQAQRVEDKKKEQKSVPALSGQDLSDKLDKLISDDSVDL